MGDKELRLFGTFTKVNDEERTVEGVITSEAEDVQEDVVDYEATKVAVEDWRKWGNIREMHQPKAAGVAETITLNDDAKNVVVKAKVVDDDAWAKVKAGVYKGYSIGGKVLASVMQKAGDHSVRRITNYLLTEVSLVDRPANPEAVFSVVKRAEDEAQPAGEVPPGTPWQAPPEPTADSGSQDAPPASKAERTGDLQKDISFEAIRDKIRANLPKPGPFEAGPYYWVVATFADHVVVEDESAERYFSIPYTIAGEDVTFGTPVEVQVAYTPVSADAEEVIVQAAAAITDLAKAGKQLSSSNVDKIHGAISSLATLCAGAGCQKCATALKAYEPEGEGETEKRAAAGAEQAPVLDTEVLNKAVQDQLTTALAGMGFAKAADIEKAVEGLAKAEQVTALEGRVKTLEDAPAPGGPMLRAGAPVEKVLGGGAAPAATDEIGLLAKMIGEVNDPTARDVLGRELAYRQALAQRQR